MTIRLATLTMMLVLVAAAPCRCDDRCYVMVFAVQRPVNLPRFSHSFATFVRTRGTPAGPALEAFTISWLPRSLSVEPCRLRPEPGRNLDLHSSLDLAVHSQTEITLWGPYQVRPELYERALRQKTRLESGAVAYKACGSGGGCNCVDAVEEVVGEKQPLRVARHGWGYLGSRHLAQCLRPWVIEPPRTHDWIMPALGITQYPVRRAPLE